VADELIDLVKAEEAVARTIAQIESQLNSSLMPEAQKFGLVIAHAQLLGSFAQIRRANIEMAREASTKKLWAG